MPNLCLAVNIHANGWTWLSTLLGWRLSYTCWRVVWCWSFISHTQAWMMSLRTIWAVPFGIAILCNVEALETDETRPLFLEYVLSFTDIRDGNTVYWFVTLLEKDTCNCVPHWCQSALKVGGGGLGGFFLSGVVEGVVAIELHLSRASTSLFKTLRNSSRLQFPVSNSLLIFHLSSWGTLLRRTWMSRLPYC